MRVLGYLSYLFPILSLGESTNPWDDKTRYLTWVVLKPPNVGASRNERRPVKFLF